jgi:23S rRNA pseudouridine1911/1915/1917 synthase
MSGSRTLSEIIPDALGGERIDRVVALVADVSRREAVELIASGQVLVDGRSPDKPSLRVEVGSSVVVEVEERASGLDADSTVAFDVVHADDHVVVVDKPAHLVVHPGSGVQGATLANGLLARFPEVATVGDPERPGIVHRLDKGTSGLLMVARTDLAYQSLVAQLASRSVTRRYTTVACGLVEADSGLIDAPLGRSIRDATRRAVVADGKPARTRYDVSERFGASGCTLLQCRLETGRTHQIRAHLAAIDHPVLGDERYGGRAATGLTRPFLHAAHLGFVHPATGETLGFDSPLPADLESVLEGLAEAEPDG